MGDKKGKYLIFALANEEYGVAILKVMEIITMAQITRVPRTSEFVKGVMNLRGKVVPVVDLRLRLGMKSIDYTEQTCIIVVEVAEEAAPTMIGIVVDEVKEVLNIDSEEIEDTPDLGTNLDTGYILGMAKTEKGVKILLDIDLLLSTKEVSFVNSKTVEE
jgi:purine-binding chemotaxis protein CheW